MKIIIYSREYFLHRHIENKGLDYNPALYNRIWNLMSKEVLVRQLYISELSNLTGISKRTLHHYDHIDLIKPSLGNNASNGYRLYSEEDLLKLRQVISLKAFGFKLAQIKNMLDPKLDLSVPLKKQLESLEKRTKAFNEVNKILQEVIFSYHINKNVSWEDVIKRIEIYRNLYNHMKK